MIKPVAGECSLYETCIFKEMCASACCKSKRPSDVRGGIWTWRNKHSIKLLPSEALSQQS